MFKVTKTAGDVATDIKRTFGDEAGVQVTDSDIFRWINAAQVEIVSKNDVLRAVGTTLSVKGQFEYNLDLSMSIHKIQSIQYNGSKLRYMSFQDAEKFIDSEDPNRISEGTPQIWFDWGSVIQLFPTPPASNDAIKIYYTPLPTDVSALTSPLSLPDNYYNRIVDYVMARAYEMDENFSGHQAKMGQFSDELLNMSNNQDTHHIEYYPTITVRPEDM